MFSQCCQVPLRRVLGRALLSRDEFVTVLAEIQHVVNDRPLTYVGDLDDEVPLSLNMLLGATSDSTDADRRSQECEVATSRDQVCSRLYYSKSLREHFHRCRISYYLLSLRLFHQKSISKFSAKDVVLVAEGKRKRSLWRMACIIRLFTGKDEKQHVAMLRVSKMELLQPIQCLILFEVSSKDTPPMAKSKLSQTCTLTRVITLPQPFSL